MEPIDGAKMLMAMNTLGAIAQAQSVDELLAQCGGPTELFQRASSALSVCELMFFKASQISGVASDVDAREALLELRKALEAESPERLSASARRFIASTGVSTPAAPREPPRT